MSPEFTLVQKLAIWALPVVFAITVREMAHGYAARWLGDDTATRAGRLSPNPLRHISPVGTLLVPGILLALGGFLIGWPKSIPIDYSRLRTPKRDLGLVAIAGLLSNLLMATIWAVLLKLALVNTADDGPLQMLRYVGVAGVVINLLLFALHLLPIPPLDAGRVLIGVLPVRAAVMLAKLEPYGFFIVLGLALLGGLQDFLFWPLAVAEGLLFKVLGINGTELFF
jgi:Zn-dependent protease